jgi:hypothetical protein
LATFLARKQTNLISSFPTPYEEVVAVSLLQLEIGIAILAAFLIGLAGAFIAVPGRKS